MAHFNTIFEMNFSFQPVDVTQLAQQTQCATSSLDSVPVKLEKREERVTSAILCMSWVTPLASVSVSIYPNVMYM